MIKNNTDILFISGPNLNLLGDREPEIYGNKSLNDIHKELKNIINNTKYSLDFRQSNSENEIIDWIQSSNKKVKLIVINPGAFTHTSIGVLDALKFYDGYIIEIHLSNPYSREEYRHKSYISGICDGIILGFGSMTYSYALNAGINLIKTYKTNGK